MNQHNLEGVLALYAPSPKTVMLGTGPGEKYQGKAEITTADSCPWGAGGTSPPLAGADNAWGCVGVPRMVVDVSSALSVEREPCGEQA